LATRPIAPETATPARRRQFRVIAGGRSSTARGVVLLKRKENSAPRDSTRKLKKNLSHFNLLDLQFPV
jgi:hypothetical protein